MARPVQLAPGSLALVLCRLEAQEAAAAAAGTEEPGGRAIFRAFRRANARCFWNSRLARAASRLAFQGWLRRGVLLVHAPPASLQVLRDAWCRRALRPPRGFRIRAVGECRGPDGRVARPGRGDGALATGGACCPGSALVRSRVRGKREEGWAASGLLEEDPPPKTFLSARTLKLLPPSPDPELCLAAALANPGMPPYPKSFSQWSQQVPGLRNFYLGK